VPLEDVLAADADVILSVTGMAQADAQASWSQYPSLSGHQGMQIVAVDPDLLTRPGPRMLEGIEMLCTQLDQVRDEWVRGKE
jgi:iron complex transport system substrate-binding protein